MTPPAKSAAVPLAEKGLAFSNGAVDVPWPLVGRDAALAALTAALARDGRAAIVATAGQGGVGKTTLAAAYAERRRDDFRATWWIRARSRATVRADLVGLGVRLGWVAPDAVEAPAVAAVVERLRREAERLLLVCDDVTDFGALRYYLPTGTGPCVLFTCDARAWHRLAEPVEIGLWPVSVGADYLLARIGRQTERAAAGILSNLLGGLPLAHALAATYCARLGVRLAAYATRFAATPTPAPGSTRLPRPRTYETLVVAKCIELAIAAAAKLHPGAEPFLAHAAALPPEPIPLFLFEAACDQFGQPLRTLLVDNGLAAVVAALETFALVERVTLCDERDPTLRTETIRMHRLVREAALARWPSQARSDVQRKLIKGLATAYPSDVSRTPASWPRARRLDAAASAVVAPGTAIPSNVGVYASYLLDRLALYRQAALGAHADARAYFERALVIAESELGPDHPSTATILNNLALCLFQQGEFVEARRFVERALFVCERRFGGEHLETLTSLTTLALLLEMGGDLRHARSLFVRVGVVCERTLGAAHPDTASCLNNLGWLIYKQGDFERARPFLERALELREALLGAEHQDTAQTLNNLAALLRAQGDLAAAKPLHERDVAIREKVLSPEHPQTVTALNDLARLLQVQGDLAGARGLFERILEIRERVLGPHHPETAASLNNLAFLLQEQGDLAGAKRLFERTLEARKKILGANHPETATSLNNLATLLQAQGDLAGARRLFACAQDICDRRLGRDHIHAQKCRSNNASLLLQMEKPAEALRLAEGALHVHAVALGPAHPWTRESARVTADALAALGEAKSEADRRATYDLAS